ncbi:MAG: site-specific DNA-methyltransferase [Desulfarculales bacterium]|jgi:site-specific DNA-methyltransferase (adenine-specific)|nr:site-specific DNA-methyltransferase [Desulfarculales bacterium]
MAEISKVEIGEATLYHGDCRDILPLLGRADTVIADPPYMINAKSAGTGKLNPWADMCNNSVFIQTWLLHCRHKLIPGGALWSFLNWRNLVSFQKAACDMRMPIESLLVWDKECIGTGGIKGLRPTYELVAFWAVNDYAIDNRGLPDIYRAKWPSFKPNGHPAEKPVDLIKWLISISGNEGEIILDPFMGSGTVGVAALEMGRRYIGIEMDQAWFVSACQRIAKAVSNG